MTQTSRPTAQHVNNYPDGDSGPYSSLQWRNVFKMMFSCCDNQGPIAGYLNELEVTNPIGRTLRVASGGAVVGGNIFFNSANVDFSSPIPTAAARYDTLVVCLNDTDTPMTVSDGGYSLAFPDDLTDYDNAASIPEYSCRLAILLGSEGGGFAPLDQNDDHYMIPLFETEMSAAGVISDTVDARELVRQRTFFIPAMGGYNVDDATNISVAVYDPTNPGPNSRATGVLLPDNKEAWGAGEFAWPQDICGAYSIKAVVICGSAGNLYSSGVLDVRECSGGSLIDDDVALAATSIAVTTRRYCVSEIEGDEGNDLAGELARIQFTRDASVGDDTIGDDVCLCGWIMTYSAAY